jgi:penicillin-binding protein 1C
VTRARGLAAVVALAGLVWLGVVGLAAARSRLVHPPPTVQLTDRHGEFLGEVGAGGPADDGALGFWPVDPLPARVVAATLALEDRRFWEHPGVDLRALARAARQNLEAGRFVSGASTIAMQVARMQDPGPRSLPRKAVETLTAALLVSRHGREAVLRQYLTLAPYGNNVYGISYAARRYFDAPVDDLSWAQTALLAAIPQSPAARNVYTADGLAHAVARGRVILDVLLADGVLDPVDHAAASEALGELRPLRRPLRPASTLHALLALAPELSGERVATSLDLSLQGRVQRVLHDGVAGWASRGAGNAAAVVVDLQTLQVLAQVGSTGWYDAEHKGAIDYSRARRYPGSTLKPFLYAAALDQGLIDPGTVLDDLARGPDGIGNADGLFLGPLLPRVALANSRNVPLVALTRRMSLEGAYSLLARAGLHDQTLPPDHYGLGLAIGGMPTTLLQLTRAWAALATDGQLRELQFAADAALPPGAPLVSPGVARWVALALSDPLARLPTFPRMGTAELPFATAIKTGTSPDFRDAWAVAFTRTRLVAVWVGHPDWRPMEGLSGYRAASRLARAILLDLHPDLADGLSDVGFPAPEGWSAARVCPWSGERAGEACSGAFEEWFPPGTEPTSTCRVHRREGGRVVVDLPPRYAAWLAAEHLDTPAGRSDGPVWLELLSPRDGASVELDPEAPAGWSTLRLAVAVEPEVPEVVWFVDGEPWKVVGPPYEARWPVMSGEHSFEAGLPWRPERSERARVLAR